VRRLTSHKVDAPRRDDGLDKVTGMKKLVASSLPIACVVVLGACSSGGSTDLPESWSGAASVKTLVQEECPGSDLMFSDEGASFTGGTRSIGVVYQDAHFRCEQKVEAFSKTAGDAVDILVQPIDMDPKAVAMCDCGYKITFTVEPVAAGTHTTTLYRRWDNITQPNDPVSITSASVIVQ